MPLWTRCFGGYRDDITRSTPTPTPITRTASLSLGQLSLLRPLIFTHEQAKDCKFLRFLNKPSLKGDKPHCRRGPLWCVLAFDPERARSSIR